MWVYTVGYSLYVLATSDHQPIFTADHSLMVLPIVALFIFAWNLLVFPIWLFAADGIARNLRGMIEHPRPWIYTTGGLGGVLLVIFFTLMETTSPTSSTRDEPRPKEAPHWLLHLALGCVIGCLLIVGVTYEGYQILNSHGRKKLRAWQRTLPQAPPQTQAGDESMAMGTRNVPQTNVASGEDFDYETGRPTSMAASSHYST